MDLVTAMLAKMVLEKHPGGKIFFDLRSSKSVKEIIEENGGIALECPVGHAKIKKLMRDNGAVFAGELSGHYFFEENFMSRSFNAGGDHASECSWLKPAKKYRRWFAKLKDISIRGKSTAKLMIRIR